MAAQRLGADTLTEDVTLIEGLMGTSAGDFIDALYYTERRMLQPKYKLPMKASMSACQSTGPNTWT